MTSLQEYSFRLRIQNSVFITTLDCFFIDSFLNIYIDLLVLVIHLIYVIDNIVGLFHYFVIDLSFIS